MLRQTGAHSRTTPAAGVSAPNQSTKGGGEINKRNNSSNSLEKGKNRPTNYQNVSRSCAVA